MEQQNQKQTKNKIAILVTGIGSIYLDYSKKMIASLLKTNPKITEVADIILMTDKDFQTMGGTPHQMLYMTPWFAKYLFKQYETVVRLDSDMVITGDISSCWEGDFDVAVVQNGNPREVQAQIAMMGKPVGVLDVDPLHDYVNCGFVVMKNEAFVDNWIRLCTPERQRIFQFYEQDFLNIMVHYGNWKVKFLDKEDNHKWFGLIAKGYYAQARLKDNKLILPAKSGTEQDTWPEDDFDREIVCIHFAGGSLPNKFDYINENTFQPEVVTHLKSLITDGKTSGS